MANVSAEGSFSSQGGRLCYSYGCDNSANPHPVSPNTPRGDFEKRYLLPLIIFVLLFQGISYGEVLTPKVLGRSWRFLMAQKTGEVFKKLCEELNFYY